jgi:hypothetical protein
MPSVLSCVPPTRRRGRERGRGRVGLRKRRRRWWRK